MNKNKSQGVKSLMDALDAEGKIKTEDGLTWAVTVRDVRSAYGRTQYLIEPIAGGGRAWKDAKNVIIDAKVGKK